MHKSLNLIIATLLVASAGTAYAAPARKAITIKPKLVVTISLSKQTMWISKRTGKKLMHVAARTLPVVKGTMRLGTFKPDKMRERFQSAHGNVYLENVIRFDHNKQIRSSRHFAEWQISKRPAARVVVLEPETGSLLYTTIMKVGMDKTQIRIIP